MKRTPYHRNILIFKKLEIACDFLDILHNEVILPGTWLQSLPDVKGSLVAIEGIAVEVIVVHAIVPVRLAVGHIPVPHIVHKTVCSPLLLRGGNVIVVLHPAPVVRSRRELEEKEIISCEGGMPACMIIDSIYEIILVGMARLHAGKSLLSALLEQEVIDILSLLGGIRIDKGLDRIQVGRHVWLYVFH